MCQTINHYLFMAIRVTEGRETSPSAGIIDSQSLNITESGRPCGYDVGNKIRGRCHPTEAIGSNVPSTATMASTATAMLVSVARLRRSVPIAAW